MEVVSIDGVEYEKASKVAKRFKYTADYVGQLCRGKKVDAKLVGRTWYVNPLSLTTHKSGKYPKSEVAEKTLKIKSDNEISRIDVQPVLRKTAVNIISNSDAKSHFAKRIDWKPVKYEEDKSDLLPNLNNLEDSGTRLKVEIAGSEKLRIKDVEKPINMVAEALPTVSLKGSLKVLNIEDEFSVEALNRLENIVKSEEKNAEKGNEVAIKIKYAKREALEKVKINHAPLREVEKEKPKPDEPKEIPESKATYDVEINKSPLQVLNFAPDRVHKVIKNEFVHEEESDESKGSSQLWLWLIISLIAIGAFLAVLFLEINVVVFSNSYDLSFILSAPDFE